ncbi:DUF2285 domain-containing protein [Rhizobiaceae bacterium BDR2-2]|uniref:DUF2285 domain-containing protein n=1 Tax=Ectorhizobium quercum TaxID=2965071 RepID=A0AAE3SX58_9HYPH|nr:DUF2285 domain-containing protein [Ectorhizobium quercum]MCX8999428.1 DUF2285 domain-containing protein [Ectorhizobium quercum]
MLAQTPLNLPASFAAELGDLSPHRRSADGDHRVHVEASTTSQLLFLPDVQHGVSLAAMVILDAHALDRIDALVRFWRAWHGRAVPDDPRMTKQQRLRFRQMIQASDGRSHGASYREIATVIYGAERIRSEPWKTSALREVVIRLVRGGNRLIDGGYLQLLHHRRIDNP